MNQPLVDLVKACYGDSHGLTTRLLDFKTEGIRDFETFSEAVKMIGKYNNFDPEKVNEAMKVIWPVISYVQIGREGSPVLYVNIPYWDNQRTMGSDSAQAVKLTKEEQNNIIFSLKKEIYKTLPDEVSVENNVVRLWWD